MPNQRPPFEATRKHKFAGNLKITIMRGFVGDEFVMGKYLLIVSIINRVTGLEHTTNWEYDYVGRAPPRHIESSVRINTRR